MFTFLFLYVVFIWNFNDYQDNKLLSHLNFPFIQPTGRGKNLIQVENRVILLQALHSWVNLSFFKPGGRTDFTSMK